MPERDNTLVTIVLDQARPYRDRETMIVKTVGPGEATVPRYVAERWAVAAEDAPLAEVWPGYDALHADAVKQRLRALSPDERERVRAYEIAKKNRLGVLNVLDALEAEKAGGVVAESGANG